jgi:hypothetical protein
MLEYNFFKDTKSSLTIIGSLSGLPAAVDYPYL